MDSFNQGTEPEEEYVSPKWYDRNHLYWLTWDGICNNSVALYYWWLRFFTSFIGLHYLYIVSMAILSSIIIYPQKNMSYTDALFQAVSIATNTGLNTIPLADMKVYQQVVSYIVPILVHPLVINGAVVVARLHWFEQKFDNIAEMSKRHSKMRRAATKARAQQSVDGRSDTPPDPLEKEVDLEDPVLTNSSDTTSNQHPPAERDIRFGDLPMPSRREYNTQDMFRSLRMMKSQPNADDLDEDDGPALVIKSPRDIEFDEARGIAGVVRRMSEGHISLELRPDDENEAPRRRTSFTTAVPPRLRQNSTVRSRRSSVNDLRHTGRTMTANYLSWTPTVGRNSTFVGLTREQKDELGGVEHRALRLLLMIIVGYFLGLLIIAMIMFVPWTYARTHYKDIIESEHLSPGWHSAFLATSSFCNLGMSLSGDSLTIFQRTAYIPLLVSFFIMFGNTAVPVGLRLVIWIMFKLTPPFGRMHETLAFLLDHPRRCFMLLFPSGTTMLLFVVLCLFNVFDLILFVIFDLGRSALTSIPMNYRVMCGFVQSVCTRIAGFSILPLPELHIAVRFSYILLMYVSVYPLAISIRKTNVYEEQTLGIYGDEEDFNEDERSVLESAKSGGIAPSSPLLSHMQRQLSHDLWYLVLGLFLVIICEAGKIERSEIPFFDVLFEVVSAYGTVGMSMGFPTTSASLSSQFSTVGKLVIMALMIRGRHRGLPYRVDRSIILKGGDVEVLDDVQQTLARHPTVLQQRNNLDNWSSRVETTASRLRRVGTTASRLRPTFTSLSGRSQESRGRQGSHRAMST